MWLKILMTASLTYKHILKVFIVWQSLWYQPFIDKKIEIAFVLFKALAWKKIRKITVEYFGERIRLLACLPVKGFLVALCQHVSFHCLWNFEVRSLNVSVVV